MSNNRRFALDEKRKIIDAVNPANSGKAPPSLKATPKMISICERTYLWSRLSNW